MGQLRRVRTGTLVFYYLFTLGAAAYRLLHEPGAYNALLAVAAFALPVVPPVLWRVCRLRSVLLAELVFDWFVFAAVPFASLFGAYDLIPYWDKILHFLSGFLFAVLGTAVYFAKKPGHALDPADAFNAALYTWMFAMMSAVLWEIWEYLVSFSGADPQQVAVTGVGDTMGDIIVCTVGGLLTALSCWKYLRRGGKGHTGLMMRLFEAVYRENIRNRP
ncbi:MAG TPA: hypothetical protein H9790_04265 [Candidatus Agathobaculum intestinipullorum]|nr:hypothetical protein [Candidatus Agathobaculum intestinipullorum]